MGQPLPLRPDYDAPVLRAAARRSKDAAQARRLLALAAIYDGASWTKAARPGSVTLQIVRDWVLQFNAEGPEGLIDRKAPGQPPRLGAGGIWRHKAGLAGCHWPTVCSARSVAFRYEKGMRPATPDLRAFAQRLLAIEATAEPEAAGSAASRVTEKLRLPLTRLAGVAGFRALHARALALASDELRWLKAVRIDAAGSLEGLDDVRPQLPPDEFARGETTLIARLIGLLVTFIGEALTLRLVQDVWPEVSSRDLAAQTEEEHG